MVAKRGRPKGKELTGIGLPKRRKRDGTQKFRMRLPREHESNYSRLNNLTATGEGCKKGKGSFYIAQYPVRWTAQSASHFLPSLTDLFIPTPFSASPGSILARQQLRAKTKSFTFPPLSIARYSFIQLSEQGRL